MIAGHHKEADALAAASLLALIDRAPVIRSGPIRVAAVASTLAPGVAELVVGCFNIRGLAALEHNDPAAAHQYFAAGYQVAVATLQLQPTSPVCVDLVWWLAFHAATSAQAADLPAATKVAEQYAVRIGHMTTINQTSAAQMRARAIDEGILQA